MIISASLRRDMAHSSHSDGDEPHLISIRQSSISRTNQNSLLLFLGLLKCEVYHTRPLTLAVYVCVPDKKTQCLSRKYHDFKHVFDRKTRVHLLVC